MSADVQSETNGHTVDYKIIGTKEEVDEAIAHLMGCYPTPGYGTWFGTPRDLGDGRWEVRGDRLISCD